MQLIRIVSPHVADHACIGNINLQCKLSWRFLCSQDQVPSNRNILKFEVERFFVSQSNQ